VNSKVTRPANADAILTRLLPLLTTDGSGTISLTSPLDGAQIADVPASGTAAVDSAFASARAAQPAWAAKSVTERAAVVLRFHDAVLAEQEEILNIIQWENGKSRGNAMDELLDVALTARYYGRSSARHLRTKRRRGAFPIVTKTHELRHPRGVIGVISPWNYPFTLAVSDFLPAIIAGNTIVLKPDAQTPLTALWAFEKLLAAGLPAGVVNIVNGDGAQVGPQIVERADYVMFTGSTRVGRTVAAQAGERLISSSMELGGKNSLVVGRKVNIEFAADIAARGAFANAGQLCIGTERIAVHESVFDAFVTEFTTRVAALRVGSEIGWGTEMGTLINARQIETTQRHIADAVAQGATVLVGGSPLPEVGPLAFAPTVLLNVPATAEVCNNETFGPVCSIYKWSSDDELVAFVNNTAYGLNAAIISRDLAWARRLAPRLKAGTVNINEAFGSAYASIDAPMGGMGQSGVGRRHGVEGLLKYTEPQTVSQQRWMQLSPQWWLDDRGWAGFTTFAMKLLKLTHLR